jgi:rod shape-determining protein MreB
LKDVALDLGTATTRVFVRGKGLVVDEPTVIAVDTRTDDVVAIGADAVPMIGRTTRFVEVTHPMRRSAISDFDLTRRLVKSVLDRAGASRFSRPRAVMCVPATAGPVEHRALRDALKHGGAGSSYLLEQPLAAALGAGLPVQEPLATMVVDIGAGLTEAAVMSLASIVAREPIRVASNDFDAGIAAFVRREYGVSLSDRTAEEVKVAVGAAPGSAVDTSAEVRGVDVMSGLPKAIIVQGDEVAAALDESLQALAAGIVRCLAELPAELANDLLDTGLHLAGGGALLRGIDAYLAAHTGVPVTVVAQPRHAVVAGAARCLELFTSLQSLFVGEDRV